MSGLEGILNIIEAQQKQNEDIIIKAAQSKAERIKADGEEKAQRAYEEYLAKAKTDNAREHENACSSVDAEMKRKVLECKVELIDEAVERTLEKLRKLPDGEYFVMLERLISQKLRAGNGILALGVNDLKRLPADFEAAVQESAAKVGGTITLSKDTADISDGFILSYGLISENCSFRAVIESERDEVRDAAVSKLFG
mgnify:CR=1 FL=1